MTVVTVLNATELVSRVFSSLGRLAVKSQPTLRDGTDGCCEGQSGGGDSGALNSGSRHSDWPDACREVAGAVGGGFDGSRGR